MKKLILFVLIISLLSLLLLACSPNNQEKETTTVEEEEEVIPTDELDKNSDLILALMEYMEDSLWDYDMDEVTAFQKINAIKSGAQPIHVAFDATDYYFVCAYYNSEHEVREDSYYCCAQEYTWVKYKNETEIQEYYNGMKCVVAFQLNRALIVSDLLPNGRTTPDMEHFQFYRPTFENGVNVGSVIIFDKTFVYLNNFLNKFEDKTIYHSTFAYYHENIMFPCVYLDDEYYISRYLFYTKDDTEDIDIESALREDYLLYDWGEYYDAIVSVVEIEKRENINNKGITDVIALISLEDFANVVLK